MKILHTTDFHFTSTQPKNRLEPYMDALLTKLEFIVQYINRNPDITHWLDTGDFFHTNSQNCSLVNKIQKILMELRVEILPLIVIPGNHLIKGNEELSIANSGLQTMQDSGLASIKPDPYIFIHPDTNISMLMWHHTVVREPVPWDHILFKDVVNQYDVDFVLCSHYHPPQKLVRLGKTLFVAPGSMARGMGHEKDLTRKPRFSVIDTETKKVKFVEVPCSENPFKEAGMIDGLNNETGILIQSIRKGFDDFEAERIDFIPMLDQLLSERRISKEQFEYLKEKYIEIDRQ